MKRKLLCLVLCGVMTFPLAGCELTINGKKIFGKEEEKQQIVIQPPATKEEPTPAQQYTEEELIRMVKEGSYSLKLDGVVVDTFVVRDVIDAVYPEQHWTATATGNEARITVYTSSDITNADTEYMQFKVDLTTGKMEIIEVKMDGIEYTGADARAIFVDILAQLSDKVNTEQPQQPKQEAKKEEKKKEADVKLDYVCAQCGKQMYKSMLNGSHENDFCSTTCQDKWYTTQREMNEKKYNCLWCGAAMNEHQYNTWNGCCSEICAVSREGTAYENYERDQIGVAPGKDENMYQGPVPDGGVTICGWCGARVTDDGAFCSDVCEKAHHDYYGVN